MTYPLIVQDLLNDAGVVVSNSIIEIAWWMLIPTIICVWLLPYKPFRALRTSIETSTESNKILAHVWWISVCIFALAADKTQYNPMKESDMPILHGIFVKAEYGWKGGSNNLTIEIGDHKYNFGIGNSTRTGGNTMESLKSLPTGTPIDVSIMLARFNYKVVPRVAKIVVDNETIYVESPYNNRVVSFKEHQILHYARLLLVVVLSYFFFRKRKIKSKMDLR